AATLDERTAAGIHDVSQRRWPMPNQCERPSGSMNRCDERLGDTVFREVAHRAVTADIEDAIEVFGRHLLELKRVRKCGACRLIALEPLQRLGCVAGPDTL